MVPKYRNSYHSRSDKKSYQGVDRKPNQLQSNRNAHLEVGFDEGVDVKGQKRAMRKHLWKSSVCWTAFSQRSTGDPANSGCTTAQAIPMSLCSISSGWLFDWAESVTMANDKLILSLKSPTILTNSTSDLVPSSLKKLSVQRRRAWVGRILASRLDTDVAYSDSSYRFTEV